MSHITLTRTFELLEKAVRRVELGAGERAKSKEEIRALKTRCAGLVDENDRLRARAEFAERQRREAGPEFKIGDRVHVTYLPGTGTIDGIFWTRGRVEYRVRYFIAGDLKCMTLYDDEIKAMPEGEVTT